MSIRPRLPAHSTELLQSNKSSKYLRAAVSTSIRDPASDEFPVFFLSHISCVLEVALENGLA